MARMTFYKNDAHGDSRLKMNDFGVTKEEFSSRNN
jgi:uncharacterized protein (DUF2141 family)